MGKRAFGTGLALAALLALAAPTLMTSSAQAQDSIVIGGTPQNQDEARDLATVNAAMAAFQQGGYPALQSHLAGLKTALDGAPDSYPTVESVSPGVWVVRSNHQGDALMLSILTTAAVKDDKSDDAVTVSTGPNVYPLIALLLGSEAVERGAMEEAIRYLDRGLALQPGAATLAAEKMGAMQAQGRMAEALAVGDAVLALDGPVPLREGRGILHRRRGFSLIELGRLDEARDAFNESLVVDPDNPAALGELQYIDGLEGGKDPVPGIAVRQKGD